MWNNEFNNIVSMNMAPESYFNLSDYLPNSLMAHALDIRLS